MGAMSTSSPTIMRELLARQAVRVARQRAEQQRQQKEERQRSLELG